MQKEMNIKIDRFLCGEMSADEQKAFEKEILYNSELATEVQLHREVAEVLSNPQRLDFLHTINHLNQKFSDPVAEKPEAKVIPVTRNESVLRKIWPKMLAAASVAAIIFCAVYMYPADPKPVVNGLYTDYNIPPDFHANENVMGKRTAEELSSGTALFDAKKYEEALLQLEAELKSDPDNINLKFMLAYANSEVGNDDVATATFDELLKHEDFILLDEIKWYNALHLLKMKKPKDALKMMESISSEFMDMGDKRELQKQVEQMMK